MADRRVVVTWMGITSCLGNTLEDVTKSLHECVSGLDYDPEWAELGIKSNVRGRPTLTDAEFKTLIPKADLRFMGKNAQYAYVAMQRAVEDSGMKPEDYQENPRVCAILGQGGTSIPDIVETDEAVKGGGVGRRPRHEVHGVDRERGIGDGVQGPGYEFLHLVGVLHRRPLHRDGVRADPAQQGRHGLLRGGGERRLGLH